ncbi:MAG: FCD domain-containing protein [Candidatus Eisenbacteria bacterium]|nr:FCD domain-containing protein [Candidatus Eisenbacteria bacterium]
MLQRIQNVNIQKEAQKRIREHIRSARLRAGDAIPTEKELAERIGISRAAVRESLKGLETLGVIEARHGIGRFVRQFDFNAILENIELHVSSDSQAFRDLFEIRRCLESNFIVAEIPKLTEQDIRDLESIVDQMEEHIRNGEETKALIDGHPQFHSALFKRSGNRLLGELIRVFSSLHYRLLMVSDGYREDLTRFIDDHRRVVAALQTRQPQTVSRTVYDHFTEPAAWSATGD